jgi:hypothetical protein
MSRSYLLVYNDAYSSQENMVEVLNKCPTIIFWRYDMPNVFYLTSENDAFAISNDLSRYINNNGKYIVLEYNGNAQGSLTKESWYLLNNRRHQEGT